MTKTPSSTFPRKNFCQVCGRTGFQAHSDINLVRFGPHTASGEFLVRLLCDSCEWSKQRAYTTCERVAV